MTDAVRHLDAGVRRHDETSLRLKARDFNHPERDINSAEHAARANGSGKDCGCIGWKELQGLRDVSA
jgi:hypothetical protein